MAEPYPNGKAPKSAMIHRGGNHWLPPGTNAAWDAFVADGKQTYGVTFVITPRGGPDDITNGENGYRFLDTQKTARAKACARGHCGQAAYPGTSPHGDGRAIDVYNWGAIPWARFVALCKKHGFVTLTVPGERWHIYYTGDVWAAAAGGGGGNPFNPQEEDMPITILERKNNSQAAKSLYNPTTGKAIRQISKDENSSFRAAGSSGAVIYVSVSDAEYKERGGF